MTAPSKTSAGNGRTVARPVANLGNTCFANAVLQALAHAPELCLAIDCRPHASTCPVAIDNAALLRASPTASPIDDASRQAGTRKSRRSVDRNVTEEDDAEFCALCAFESHIQQVHDSSQSKDKPVAPEAFIKGFVNHVAPWMRIGIQEDSHEFLRLLIDAMQKSCVKARNKGVNPQESPSAGDNTKADSGMSPEDKEYPFSLFRGTVESNVTCENCNASSSTMDPIEDIGLEVTVQSSASDSVSPSPLTDVQTAFSRFARTESLDGNYKCEKCGKVGRATKQSRLATIPPILTLHLKRFRYGDSGRGSDAIFRRSGRSEVKSGSAKIDGHIKFDVCLDLKPYLTKEMQSKTKSGMLCRLFAVVVHAGKNSNSGHYVAYVRSLGKNEWWKMDDGRVSPVPESDVLQAEAYMLFYRVVQHPVTQELEEAYKTKLAEKAMAECIVLDDSNTKESNKSKRKRRVSYRNGEEWVRAKSNLPPHLISIVHKVQELVAGNVQLVPEFFRLLSEEAERHSIGDSRNTVSDQKPNDSLPAAVAGICEDDAVGGVELHRCKLGSAFHDVAIHLNKGGQTWSLTGERDPSPLPLQSKIPYLPEIISVSNIGPVVASKPSAVTVSVVEPEEPHVL